MQQALMPGIQCLLRLEKCLWSTEPSRLANTAQQTEHSLREAFFFKKP
jgi:hypothetical protein